MIEKLKKKLNSRAGETISETLVALLISALALTMLAGAISASLSLITKSRVRMNLYYDANEAASGVVKMSSGGTSADDGITIKDSEGKIVDMPFDVDYYKNGEFSQFTVVSYKYKKQEVTTPASP